MMLVLLALSMQVHGQHSLGNSMNSTMSSMPVTPQRPLEPGSIDTLIVPINYHEEYMPDPFPPPPSPYSVGIIPYDIVRANNGRVGVNIPIESFSDEFERPHGMSLSYQGDNRVTVMGRGWNLSGASVISRCGRDFFTDGNTAPVCLDDDGVWSLDGMRLILQGTANGVRRYRTQVGNTIALQDASGHFTVLHPDGGKSYYDERDSLRHYVTRYVGLDGKEVTYSYTNSHHGYRMLTSVSYGEGRHLVLHYRQTSGYPAFDNRIHYKAGVVIEPRHRLDSIYVTKGDRVLATYAIQYLGNLLSDVEPSIICRLDSSGQLLFKPLKFAYHGVAENTFKKTFKSLGRMLEIDDGDMSKLIVSRGRFDPASEDEGFLLFANRQSYNRVIDGVYSSHYESCYSTADRIVLTPDMHHDGHDIPCAVVETDTCFVEALAMDIDGDAGDELVRVNNHVQGSQDVTVFTVLGNVNSIVQPLFSRSLSMPALSINGHYSVRPKAFLPGDFDGDGRADMLVLSYSNPAPISTPGRIDLMDLMTGIRKATFSLDSCTIQSFSWDDPLMTNIAKWWGFNHSDRILMLDHDGDGKKELGVVNEHGLFLYSFSFGPSGNVVMCKTKADCPVTLNDFECLDIIPCDLNGDGNTDLTTARKKPADSNGDIGRITMMSDGSGKFITRISQTFAGNHDGQVALTDYDRDGCTDIFYNGGYGNTDLGLTADRYLIGGNVFDGRLANLAALGPNGEVTLYQYDSPTDVAYTLAAINDGSGKEHVFTHGRMFLNHDTSFSPQHFDYPLCAVAEGMLINTREQLLAGDQTLSDTHFKYSYPVVHMQGLGFLGFETVEHADSITGNSVIEAYSPENLGMLCHVDNNKSESDYALDKSIAPDKHINVIRTQESSRDKATDVTVTTAYTHDSYGNVLTATTTYPGNIIKAVTNEYQNVDDGDNWLVGLERRHTESVTRGGETVTEGRTTHYNALWLPDTAVTWRGGEQHPVSTRAVRYDNANRPDRIRTRAYEGDWLTRHIGYSDQSRQPQFVSDEQGLRTTLTYGDFGIAQASVSPETMTWNDDDDLPVTPIIGPISPLGGDSPNGGSGTIIDPTGYPPQSALVTSWHYDTFGRQDSVTAPDGSVRKVTLSWSDDVPGALYMSEQTETGKPTVRTWHDVLGRKVRQATQRFDGRWAATLYEYDTYGRLSRESMPTMTGNASNWIEYEYDSFDRPISKTHLDGHTDTYSYDGLTATSVIDGVATTRTVDALGNLVEAEDAGGTLHYTVRPDGLPSAIHAPGGIVTTFEYDVYGRRTAIHDPSAGTHTTTYDNNGHVAAETDACGKTVTSTYNARGLLTSRTFDRGLTATYTYNAWGLPLSMSGSDGHSKSWTYNGLQQLASEIVDGFRKTYTYDRNMVSSVAYSQNNSYICTENYSRMNGHLTSVTLGTGETIWTLRAQNSRLLPTQVGRGGLSQSLSYDLRGNVAERAVTAPDESELQWVGCEYDTVSGNMVSRADWLRVTAETFEHDNLNRLTGITLHAASLQGYRDFATTYDGKGDILSHHTSGQYGYGTAKPYAFNELLSPSALIPQREQHITFNAMQQPDTISEGGYTAVFSYYGDMTRATMTVTDSLGGSETRAYYDQQYNEFTKATADAAQTKRILWLGGTAYDAPAALVRDYGEAGWRLVHVLRDNLGSITHVVDTAGTVLQELSYSAWGLLRDPQTLEPYASDAQPDLLLGRGYTGHEHLPWFGLVNMNARLYDPAVGRFLSPDPMVQAPDNTQNYNRYSYCLNNPLKFVDENGDMYWQTTDPDEIRIIWGYIQNEGYDKVTVNGIMGQWNPFKWHGTNNDITVTHRGCTYDFFCYVDASPAGGCSTISGYMDFAQADVIGVKIYHYGTIVDPTMSLYPNHDTGFENPGLVSAALSVAKNELSKSNAVYSITNNNGYANINVKVYDKLSKNGRYSVTNSVRGLAKPLGRVAAGITVIDVLYTAIDGHPKVAIAKGVISLAEYGVASVPGGVFLVLGFELLDAHCHFTDNIYKSFDSSYQ